MFMVTKRLKGFYKITNDFQWQRWPPTILLFQLNRWFHEKIQTQTQSTSDQSLTSFLLSSVQINNAFGGKFKLPPEWMSKGLVESIIGCCHWEQGWQANYYWENFDANLANFKPFITHCYWQPFSLPGNRWKLSTIL